MECRDFQKKIPEYLAGCLLPERVVMFEDHISHCQACRELVSELRQLDRLIDAAHPELPETVKADEIMAELTAGIMQKVRAEKPAGAAPTELKRARRQRVLSLVQDLVAAAAAAIIIFWFSGPVLMDNNVPGYSREVVRVSNSVGGAFAAYMQLPASAIDRISDSINKIGPGQPKGDDRP